MPTYLSPQGIKAEFMEEVREIVGKPQEEIENKLQQQQIDALNKEQKEINKLQQFMYRLILNYKEVEKLKGLKEHEDNNTVFKFYVTRDAAAELRRLRDSELIIIKPPYRYIAELEKVSNYAKTEKDFIDLTKYCELTQSGKEFLDKWGKMINHHQNI